MSYSERRLLRSDVDNTPLIEVVGKESTGQLGAQLQSLLEEYGLQDHALIQDSILLAIDLHRGQKRSYERYVNHVIRVAIRVIRQLGITDPEVIAAAILHDSIEDQSSRLIRLATPEISVPVDPKLKRVMGHRALQQFAAQYGNNDVADIVLGVSIPPRKPGVSKIHAYLGYTAGLMEKGDLRARAIKHADFIDNTDAPGQENQEVRARLDIKQIGAYSLHIAALEQDESLVIDNIRKELVLILRELESEAAARIGAGGLAELRLDSNSLRSA